MRRPLRVLALASLAAWAIPAAAQDVITLPFQAPDRREARRLVQDFERHAKAENWSSAADSLQQLLDYPYDDTVVRAIGLYPARFEGTSVVARRLFDSLPAAGRDAWEKNSRARAEELLSRGLRLRREQDLRDAARRYPAADVRRRAHDALAQLALVRGDLRATRFQLAALLDAVAAEERPAVLARLAWVSASAGDVDGLADARAKAEGLLDAKIEAEGVGGTLGAALEKARRSAAAAAASPPRQFGGDEHGSRVAAAPPPRPGERQWSRDDVGFLEGNENDTDAPISRAEKLRLRPVAPVVADGFVFVNNGTSVAAFHASGGAEAWRFDAPASHPEWRDNFVSTHTVAVADGVVYAALPTRVDAGDSGAVTRYWGRTIIYPLVHRCLFAFDERTGEVLWSHETAKLAGREDQAAVVKECVSSPPLVVGDDLIVASWTYEGIFSVRVVCYDRRTGKTRWRTPIVEGQQELNLFGRPVKELSTGPLAEQGGRVFFATGLGVAAAVAREDGRIAWMTQYAQTDIPRAMAWHQTRDREVSWLPSPVTATPHAVVMAPLDSPDLVCFDPATGSTLWSKSLARPPNPDRPRGMDSDHAPYQWFAGVANDRAYVVGRRAHALDLLTGATVWTGEAGRLEFPTGKSGVVEAVGAPVLTKERLYVPSERAVFVVSAATGEVEDFWRLAPSPQGGAPVSGDLVSADGMLLVVSRSGFDVFYRPDELRARMQARLADHPDDAQIRVEVGRALASEGRLDDGVATLEDGLRLLPKLPAAARDRVDAALRRALYDSHLARAEVRLRDGDVDGTIADLRAAAAVARDRGASVRALLAVAEALGNANRRAEEQEALRDVAERFGDVVTTTSNGSRAPAGALALFRLGDSLNAAGDHAQAVATWLDLLEKHGGDNLDFGSVRGGVRQRLADLGRTDDALVDVAVHERAKKAFEAAKAANDVTALDRVARLYPDPQVAADAAMLAAETHLAAGRPRDAVGVLNSVLADGAPSNVLGRALWRLSVAYRALGETARERAALRRLQADAPDALVDERLTGADAAKRELASSRFVGGGRRLPDPRPELTLLWQKGGPDQLAPELLREGSEALDLDGRIGFFTVDDVVGVADAESGATLWERPSGLAHSNFKTTAPGAMVLVGPDGVGSRSIAAVAFSVADGRELWRSRAQGPLRGATASLGVLYMVTDGPPRSSASQSMLTAVSLATGETLATKELGASLYPSPSPGIFPAEDAVVVAEMPGPRSANVRGRRTIVVLDGMTLELRGRIPLSPINSSFVLHPPGTNVVATSDGDSGVMAIDVTRGVRAWPTTGGATPPGKAYAVPDGLIVVDDEQAVRRLDATTGAVKWRTPLAASGELAWDCHAVADDLFVATVQPGGSRAVKPSTGVAVALDAATGKELWRTNLPARGDECKPFVLASVVAYEVNQRVDTGYRSRVLLLDRATGAVLQTIQHPTIGRTFEFVTYGPDWIAVHTPNEVAVYGRGARGK